MENLSTSTNKESNKNKVKLNFKDSKYATGRRKKSIAKVWVKKGSGSIYVNGIDMILLSVLGALILALKVNPILESFVQA